MTYTVEELIARLKEFPEHFLVNIKGHFPGIADLDYITSNSTDRVEVHISKPKETGDVKRDYPINLK